MNKDLKIIECPRDAMQGITEFISTDKKVSYINSLLKVGFHAIDFGSFVSPKAIPQMKDTEEVLNKIDLSKTDTKLLVIVGNVRGCETAMKHEKISYVGFPYSVSETFLQKNLNSNFKKSETSIRTIVELCERNGKEAVIYLSMAFGNPFGDHYDLDLVLASVERLKKLGVKIIMLSDTVGKSKVKDITVLFKELNAKYPEIDFGFHLHTSIQHWYGKINAAYENGCRRFDTVMRGLGGCPAVDGELLGNLKTSNLLEYFETREIETNIKEKDFYRAYMKALQTFPLENLAK